MPVRYTISGNLFRLHMEGNYTPEDIIQTFSAAHKDPKLPENPQFLFDVTKSLELATRGTDSIKYLTKYLSENSERFGNRCAILAIKSVHFGLSRMAATFAELHGADVQVFDSEEAAISWLGARIEIGPD